MSKTDRIEARIDPEPKQAAEAVFAKLGVSPSDAIRMFYKQVELHQGFPCEVRIPNTETIAAMEEVETHPERLKRYTGVEEMFEEWDTGAEEC